MGISNTTGIKKFPMKLVKPDLDYIGPVAYQIKINFDDLGYENIEIGWFHHYYEGIFKDRTKTYYYYEKVFYDENKDIGIDHCNNIIWVDIKKPFVASNHPQFIDYEFMDIKNNIFSHNRFSREYTEPLNKEYKSVYEIKADYIIDFEVLYSDPKGNEPFERYPRLIFRNMKIDKELEYIMSPNKIISILSQYYDERFSSYICNVNSSKFPKGIWQFYFEAKDCEGNKVKNLLGKEELLRI